MASVVSQQDGGRVTRPQIEANPYGALTLAPIFLHEVQLLNIIRATGYGKLELSFNDGLPVKVEVLRESHLLGQDPNKPKNRQPAMTFRAE